MIEDHATQCPYCGEPIVLELDLSAGSQVYVEDCAVCCRPMRVAVSVAPDGSYLVDISDENQSS
jgi:hypothetical protein